MSSPAPSAPPRRRLILVAGAAAVLVLVAAVAFVSGSVTRGVAPAAGDPPIVAASPAGAGHGGGGHHGSGALELYAVQTATLGVVVTDGGGRLLYGSDRDGTNPPASRCTGECAQEWLPLVVPAGQEPDLLGVDAAVVGRVARDDGSSQLTLGGWPVYVNRSDDGALKAAAPTGQGAWFALSPEGGRVPV